MSIHRSINCLVYQLPLASSLLFEDRIWCHGSLLHIVLYRSLDAGLELALRYLLCSRLCYKLLSYPSTNCGPILFTLSFLACEVQYSSSSHSEPFNNVWQSGTTQAQSTESLQWHTWRESCSLTTTVSTVNDQVIVRIHEPGKQSVIRWPALLPHHKVLNQHDSSKCVPTALIRDDATSTRGFLNHGCSSHI